MNEPRLYFTNHAKLRAKERYGIELDEVAAHFMLNACRTKKALLCAVRHDDLPTWAMRFNDKPIIFVTNPNYTGIVTFLPADHLNSGTRARIRRQHGKRKRHPGKIPLKARR